MKEILARVLHFFSNLKVHIVCLFKLTCRLGQKEDDEKGEDHDDRSSSKSTGQSD